MLFRRISKTLVLLAAFLPLAASAQMGFFNTLYGTVTDARTGKAVPGVNVFLSETTLGAMTDSSGNYAIEGAPPGGCDLVFQHVGYEITTQTLTLSDNGNKRVDVHLHPKVLQGPEITVTSPFPREWRKRFGEFEKAFLGETGNASQCVIRNPEAVQFKPDPSGDGWAAFSDQAVVVENRIMGYTVRCHIIHFGWSRYVVTVRQKVFSIFKLIPAASREQQNRWEKNRENAYRGSVKHFLSAFARGKIKEEGFRVFESRVQIFEGSRHPLEEVSNRYPIPPDNLYAVLRRTAYTDTSSAVRSGTVLKTLAFDDWLKVDYQKRKSFITLEGPIVADTLGNIWNAVRITLAGNWGRYGLADRLPSDYVPPRFSP